MNLTYTCRYKQQFQYLLNPCMQFCSPSLSSWGWHTTAFHVHYVTFNNLRRWADFFIATIFRSLSCLDNRKQIGCFAWMMFCFVLLPLCKRCTRDAPLFLSTLRLLSYLRLRGRYLPAVIMKKHSCSLEYKTSCSKQWIDFRKRTALKPGGRSACNCAWCGAIL